MILFLVLVPPMPTESESAPVVALLQSIEQAKADSMGHGAAEEPREEIKVR